jgi:hypothetical protein
MRLGGAVKASSTPSPTSRCGCIGRLMRGCGREQRHRRCGR